MKILLFPAQHYGDSAPYEVAYIGLTEDQVETVARYAEAAKENAKLHETLNLAVPFCVEHLYVLGYEFFDEEKALIDEEYEFDFYTPSGVALKLFPRKGGGVSATIAVRDKHSDAEVFADIFAYSGNLCDHEVVEAWAKDNAHDPVVVEVLGSVK